MTIDAYQEAKTIADSLEEAGFGDYADQVRGALADGATGTEIYMILRCCLANIADDAALSAELKTRLLSLHDYLDRVLGP